jgi:hypothetical protein
MSAIVTLLFAVAVSADPPTALESTIGLPGGGEVELVAVGNADDEWWRPTGEVIKPPSFRLEPLGPNDSLGFKSVAGREWFHFIVRMSDIPNDQDVRIAPSISRPQSGTGTGIGWSTRKVVDADGDLVDGFVALSFFTNPATMPGDTIQLRVATAFGEWTQAHQQATVIPAAQGFARVNGTTSPEYAVETQLVSPTTSKRLIEYRDRTKVEDIRAKLSYSDGHVETLPTPQRHTSETYFRLEDSKPATRDPNDLDFVTFETRNLHVSTLEEIPIYSVGQLAAEQKRREQLPVFIGIGVAGLLCIVAVSWLVIITTRNRAVPDID